VSWSEANQRYLMARLQLLRLALERHAESGSQPRADERGESDFAEAQRLIDEAAAALPAKAALDRVGEAFSLSPFECDLLLLCAGVELDGSFASLCAKAQGDSRSNFATLSLALAALPEAHWTALTPAAPLRRWRLIEVSSGGSTLLQSQLRIDERVLHYLAGVSYLDDRLKGLIEPFTPTHDLPTSQLRLAERIGDFLSLRRHSSEWPTAILCGSDRDGKRGVAAQACAMLGLRLHIMQTADVPQSVAEREALARLWEREALLLGSALLLEQGEQDTTPAMISLIEALHSVLFVSVRDSLRLPQRPAFRVDVNKPNAEEQESLWIDALGEAAPQVNGEVEKVVTQFSLGAADIYAASEQACAGEEVLTTGALWNACRMLARPRLDDLAQRIPPIASWNDLVLPEPQRRTLRDIAGQVRQRGKVYNTWGFAAKDGRGLGISALFSGASGTGKTMAAEVLANDLQLDLYKIDLSQVVSKYIGETEKNLRRVFEAAEEGGVVLLFDEADALFGKRSEVKDSHDRYANIEVSYLLQRMEAYRGLAILTTNLKSALDNAFLRRLRFIVQFPFPDLFHRAEIWKRIFPPETPTSNIDFGRLARLSVPGGSIRNIALHAAFLAADTGESVTMKHVADAARSEYAKLEKPLTEAEMGGLA
jgi:ATPase family associated with various cellular activities (AAA)/Winged helix domain, variant